jgi:hypothetical protein
MRNQKGSVVPLLLAIIAVLIAGGGAYVYVQKSQTQSESTQVVSRQDELVDTKIEQDEAVPLSEIILQNEGGYPSKTGLLSNPEISGRLKLLLGDSYEEVIRNFQVETPLEIVPGSVGVYKTVGFPAHAGGAYDISIYFDVSKDNINVVTDQYGSIKIYTEKGAIDIPGIQKSAESATVTEMKVFSHPDSGITFEYPKDWSVHWDELAKHYYLTSPGFLENQAGSRIDFFYGRTQGYNWQSTASILNNYSVSVPIKIDGKEAIQITNSVSPNNLAFSLPFVDETAYVTFYLRSNSNSTASPSYIEKSILEEIVKSAVLPAKLEQISWGKYVNKQYGFSFMHPPLTSVVLDSGYMKKSIATYLTFVRNGFGQLVFVFKKSDKESFRKWYEDTFGDLKTTKGPIETEINGYSAIDVTFMDEMAGDDERHILLQKGDLIVTFPIRSNPITPDLQKMIDSFQFSE